MSRSRTLAEEFPRRETLDICREHLGGSKELRDADLALQWLCREEEGELQECPPRTGVDIRRDIRRQQIRLRALRKQFPYDHDQAPVPGNPQEERDP